MTDIIDTILKAINVLKTNNQHLLIAIDGRCSAGKTTLAAHLQKRCDYNIFHMDDFFLRPEQRTLHRLDEPGGNVDYERFLQEVFLPLNSGKAFFYQPFDCRTQSLEEPVPVAPRSINIIEGSYSCHPALWNYYALHIFLSVDHSEQLRRIALRNGTELEKFTEKWIPFEERYFLAYKTMERCELHF